MNRRKLLEMTAALPLISLQRRTLATDCAWKMHTPIPINTQEIYPTVYKDELVVAGGIAARLGVPYFTNQVFAYASGTDRWRTLPELPENLHHVALTVYADQLLAVGGFNGGYTHIWRMRNAIYALQDNRWLAIAKLPTPQAEGVVASQGGRLHIVTGQQPKGEANRQRSDHSESSLHWVWDGNAWAHAAPIPTPRNSATGGWIGDQLVIAGGRTGSKNLATTEIYDKREDRWRPGAPMPLPQAGTAGVTNADSLYVFGGEIFQPQARVFPNAWQYSLKHDTWQALPALPTPRHGCGAGHLGQRIFIVGGATEPGGNGTTNTLESIDI